MPQSDPAAAFRRLYREAVAQQIDLATVMLTAPLQVLQAGLAWAGPRSHGKAAPAATAALTMAPETVAAAEPREVPKAPRRASVVRLPAQPGAAKRRLRGLDHPADPDDHG